MKKIAAGILVMCLVLSLYTVWAPAPQRVIIIFIDAPDVGLVRQHGQVHRVYNIIPAVLATLPEPAI